MAATNERIAELRAKVTAAQERVNAANRQMYELKAELEEAEGDTFNARWSRALATGDHDTAQGCWIELEARRVLAGKPRLVDRDDAAVAAEVERLRAAETKPAVAPAPAPAPDPC